MCLQKRGKINLYINSPNLNVEGAFVADKRLVLRHPRKPLKIRWDMSAKTYGAFRRWRNTRKSISSNKPLCEIDGTGFLNIQVAPLSIPLTKSKEGFPIPDLNMYASNFDANIRIDHLKLQECRTGAITAIQEFECNISKPNIWNTPLTVQLDGNVSLHETGERGEIEGTGKIENFLSTTGSLDFNNVTTSIHAQIKKFPSVFVDALSTLSPSLKVLPSAFLGDVFNANVDAEVKKSQGKVTMDIDATACKALFSGIIADQPLYLHDPLKVVFTVTPQLNDVFNKRTDLIVVATKKPITLYIHNDGAAFSLKNFHMHNIHFKYGLLDLGQIIVKHIGNANKVNNLFNISSGENISLWFAPSELSLQGGTMYVGRTEILYNRANQFCLWGEIKFPRRRIDITLGLRTQALCAPLGIQGVTDDYVLKVPLTDHLGKIAVDNGAAARKLPF